MHILLMTNLFPNPQEPTRGVFVERMAEQLKTRGDLTIVSPLPLSPKWSILKGMKRWVLYSLIPQQAPMGEFKVFYPKFLVVPKIEWVQSISLFMALFPCIWKLNRQRKIDCINAHWLFPDGVAMSWISKILGIPLVMSAHGCDINDYLNYPMKRFQILSALRMAERVTVVSKAQQLRLQSFGMNHGKVSVVYNGIDQDKFHVRDKLSCRQRLSLDPDKKLILFVGQFVEVKGFTYLIQAIERMKQNTNKAFQVITVGEGSLRQDFMEEIDRKGLTDYFSFRGNRPHDEIPVWMGASDLFCLPSLREGCPTVVLESLSCGRPVVASRVGGLPELIQETNGILCISRDISALAQSLSAAIEQDWDEQLIASTVNGLTWDCAAGKYFKEIQLALQSKGSR